MTNPELFTEDRTVLCDTCAHAKVCVYRDTYLEIKNSIFNLMYQNKARGDIFTAQVQCTHYGPAVYKPREGASKFESYILGDSSEHQVATDVERK